MVLTRDQRIRYERNILIPDFGESAQERLLHSCVAIVGLGGLGSPVALYLAAAGVGKLTLIDSDVVELSNLQRQVIHDTSRIGLGKTESAALTLTALNPDVTVQKVQTRLTPANVKDLLFGYDVVVEATDHFHSKYLINDACVELMIPFSTAGILALNGQALFVVPGKGPCLRCLVPKEPENVPTTSELGVLGAVPGILGSVQALEVIRWLTGMEGGDGLLHTVDGRSMRLNTLRVQRRPSCRCASIRI